MSGKLTLQNSGSWQRALLAVLLTGAVEAALFVLLFRTLLPRLEELEISRLAIQVGTAVLVYVLWRALFLPISKMLPGGEAMRTVAWTLSAEALTLGEDTIERGSIRQVHVWRDRDALGNQGKSWTVNIETTGRNRVLRSVKEGALMEESARQLRTLVAALGYEDRWTET